ncbi:MAG: diaminopimelate epimerase [Candidatus Latescibacterota bacterium]
MPNAFFKGHGLGNDYIAVDPAELEFELTPQNVRTVCDRHWGLGSDGILALHPSSRADYGLRIYNPDGSEAEKSGNGLRIFARFLHATGRARREAFSVETPGGVVRVMLQLDGHGEASAATVEMGQATFQPQALPCTLTVAELVQQPIHAAGHDLLFTGVSVGNPHCVVFRPQGQTWTRDELLLLGPALESHPLFPRRTNVQLAVPTGPHSLSILVWERGAGETQASGSSACAAAAAAVRLGLAQTPVRVDAPGGAGEIELDAALHLTMTGPVAEVAQGCLSASFVRGLGGA